MNLIKNKIKKFLNKFHDLFFDMDVTNQNIFTWPYYFLTFIFFLINFFSFFLISKNENVNYVLLNFLASFFISAYLFVSFLHYNYIATEIKGFKEYLNIYKNFDKNKFILKAILLTICILVNGYLCFQRVHIIEKVVTSFFVGIGLAFLISEWRYKKY